MSIACDIQMATCDLSFEVSSDLSSWIFIWTEVKLVFSLPMLSPCEKEHSKNQNCQNLHHKLFSLIPSHSSQEPFFLLYQYAKKSLEVLFFLSLFPFFMQSDTPFSTPYLMNFLTMVWKGLVEVTTPVALCCDMDSDCGNGLACPSVAGHVIRVTGLWLRSKVQLSHWSIVIR